MTAAVLSKSRSSLLILAATGSCAAALLLVATHRWGLGVSYDSVVYVQASHHLSKIALPQPRDSGGKALYWWAPGYAVALKLAGGTYSAGRVLNAVLLLLGVLLTGGMTWRLIDRRTGLIAAGLYASSPVVFGTHLALLAEPLYLVLSIAALWLLAEERTTAAGIVIGAAALTRYAALPLILLGALVLRGSNRLRAVSISLSMYLAWQLRNELAAGQTTGRELAWHPPTWDKLQHGGRTLLHLLATPGSLPSAHLGSFAGLAAELIAIGAILYALARARPRHPPRLVTIGLALIAVYIPFVLLTESTLDALTPFDQRLFVPLFPPIAITLAWLMRDHLIAALVLIAVFAISTVQIARTYTLNGADYSGKVWSSAQITNGDLPSNDLYSTWPAAIAYFAGRSPHRLPHPADKGSGQPNPDYAAEMDALAARVRHGQAGIVVLDERVLQATSELPPILSDPRFRNECRPATRVWFVCEARVEKPPPR